MRKAISQREKGGDVQMTHWKVIRIYRVVAENKREALELVRNSRPEQYLMNEFAKEEEAGGWLSSLKKQLAG